MALTEQQLRDLISINLQTGSKITAIKHKEVENALVDAIFDLRADFEDTSMLYEVKELDVPSNEFSDFLTANFVNGKGKVGTKFEKWAICNGNNLTKNRGGRTSIGYATNYAVGDIGGYEDTILLAHSHSFNMSGDDSDSKAGALITTNQHEDLGLNGPGSTYNSLSTEGQSGVGRNMQPYIVTLFIQRIAV